MYSLRDAKTKSKRDVFKSPFIYNDPWKLIGESEPDWDLMDEKERREKISYEMAPYWKQLKSKMGGLGWILKKYTGWGWIPTKRSGFTEDQYVKL
jgi:hypothetical protein